MSELYNFIITNNDGCKVPVQLDKDGAVFNIPLSASVKAAIVSRDHSQLLAGPVNLSDTDTGSDWANSLIVANFSATDLANVSTRQLVEIEIQVTESGGDPETWYHPDGLIDIGQIS